MDARALAGKALEYAIIGILAIGVGYLFGNSEAATMRAEMRELKADNLHLEKRLDRHDRKLNGRFNFMGDASDILNYLCERNEGCERRFGAVRVPQ